jgi:hypothetical protein
VASVLSPVLVPLAFLVLGVGVVSWYPPSYPKATLTLLKPICDRRTDFRAVAFGAFTVATLGMCADATTKPACVEALRATSPPEPWLLILGICGPPLGASLWYHHKFYCGVKGGSSSQSTAASRSRRWVSAAARRVELPLCPADRRGAGALAKGILGVPL